MCYMPLQCFVNTCSTCVYSFCPCLLLSSFTFGGPACSPGSACPTCLSTPFSFYSLMWNEMLHMSFHVDDHWKGMYNMSFLRALFFDLIEKSLAAKACSTSLCTFYPLSFSIC